MWCTTYCRAMFNMSPSSARCVPFIRVFVPCRLFIAQDCRMCVSNVDILLTYGVGNSARILPVRLDVAATVRTLSCPPLARHDRLVLQDTITSLYNSPDYLLHFTGIVSCCITTAASGIFLVIMHARRSTTDAPSLLQPSLQPSLQLCVLSPKQLLWPPSLLV